MIWVIEISVAPQRAKLHQIAKRTDTNTDTTLSRKAFFNVPFGGADSNRPASGSI
jgi:hypothetical protein